MRKAAVLLLAALLLAGVCSCEEFGGAITPPPSPWSNDTSAPTPEPSGLSANDILLKLGGNEYRCGMNMSEVFSLIGTNYTRTVNIEDRIEYFYADEKVEFIAEEADGVERVIWFYATGGSWSTANGINFDSTRDDLKEKYGDALHWKSDSYCNIEPADYGAADGAEMCFMFGDDGRLLSVDIKLCD